MARGAVVKTTTLTDAFTFQSFQAHSGAQAIPLFVITASGRLDVIPADETVEPRAGDTLISLVDRDAEPVADNGGEATGGSKEA